MKKLLIAFLCFSTQLFAQDFNLPNRLLKYSSKEMVDGKPRFTSSFGTNIKLNGIYDVYGGMQTFETFNIGNIDVFSNDDSPSFRMDMYQTQLKLETAIQLDNGKVVESVVEFDFLAGGGKMRLRKAYVNFNNWQIGQNWCSFGDEALWPNVLDWEGPPSGIWIRSPHIRYSNTFGSSQWGYMVSLDAPRTDYTGFKAEEPLIEEAFQDMPDVVAAIRNDYSRGHIRLSTIFRKISYKYNKVQNSFNGYGFSLTGKQQFQKNSLQYQVTGGNGIGSYITSIGGFGYDGYPTASNTLKATPSLGGWLAYEHFWTDKFHTNFVVGTTSFETDNASSFVLQEPGQDLKALTGDFKHVHSYGIVNMMYDPLPHMTYGLELAFGNKQLEMNGTIDDIPSSGAEPIDEKRSRDALRINFGLMYFF